eukprot:TRINITY_DN109116_c0_g1_i1.p1 TRINITY_DN109116_c0_g1~~TRINITY_DN109116_c0_g1_i1.p1  ORF type:complete len:489 (+),score=72.14 TRINITY_DN109116_c0_g1_i1:49-1515(+)
MSATRDRALQVERGSAAQTSTVLLPKPQPGAGEVLVQVQAAALTPTDVLLCTGDVESLLTGRPAASGKSTSSGGTAFVPGIFFYGKVLGLGPFTEGLDAGETVLGIAPQATEALRSMYSGSHENRGIQEDSVSVEEKELLSSRDVGGCYRETICVHFSTILPAGILTEAKLSMAAVVAHLPPMVSSLTCVASNLRLRPAESLLIVAPRLHDVAFILQRLLLLSDAWQGPLFLIVLQGHAPSGADLLRHPLLRPLLSVLPNSHGGGALGSGTFLDDINGYSVEEHAKKRFGNTPLPEQVVSSLHELVTTVSASTGGVDAILALDAILSPEERLTEAMAENADLDKACSALEGPPRSTTLLRTLLSALAVRGRLVTNSRRLEMTPADGEHLWAKECSLSFFNHHCLPLSGVRHGELLHALAEVCGRLAAGELAMADSEVVQYRLFDQFPQALDCMLSSSKGRNLQRPDSSSPSGSNSFSGTGSQLITLLI